MIYSNSFKTLQVCQEGIKVFLVKTFLIVFQNLIGMLGRQTKSVNIMDCLLSFKTLQVCQEDNIPVLTAIFSPRFKTLQVCQEVFELKYVTETRKSFKTLQVCQEDNVKQHEDFVEASFKTLQVCQEVYEKFFILAIFFSFKTLQVCQEGQRQVLT